MLLQWSDKCNNEPYDERVTFLDEDNDIVVYDDTEPTLSNQSKSDGEICDDSNDNHCANTDCTIVFATLPQVV